MGNKEKEDKIPTRETGCKIVIHPNEKQIEFFAHNFGCSRFIFNHFLDMRINLYKHLKVGMNYNEMSAMLTDMKKQKEYEFLKKVDKFALQNSLKHLEDAYKRFFDRVKKRQKPYGFPRFKSKKTAKKSYTTNMTNDNIKIDLENKRICLPKAKWMSFSCDEQHLSSMKGRLIRATITLQPNGVYTASLVFQEIIEEKEEHVYTVEEIRQLLHENKVLAGDVGLRTYLTCQNGVKIPNPRYLVNGLRRLKILQKRFSRTKKKSKNHEKLRLKIAKQHAYIKNAREDFLHKITHALVKYYDVLIFEDLNVKGMIKNKKLGKHVQDAAWGTFFQFLKYKCERNDKKLVTVDRFYPSSKLCSTCKTKNNMLTLSDTHWICPTCKTHHDRDENASWNLLEEGIRQLLAS